jgi:1-deoxy-D-xylulose-5-phosphate reductoisomerase
MKTKRVLLLGSTGSIGKSTIDVLSAFPDRFSVAGLSAHTNVTELREYAARFPGAKTALTGCRPPFPDDIDYCGPGAAVRLIEESAADIVVNGIMGAAGLEPSAAAIRAGMDIALANKETIVMAGDILLPEARLKGLNILPVDSEHAAVFQLLRHRPASEISEILLTASGGPFRETPLNELAAVSVEAAMNHPTWNMGVKISIDSATMANKGLEVIEAMRFFDVSADAVKVLIHPMSMVHSIVRCIDGVMYAQLSAPDMRNPIVNALSYPETLHSDFAPLDLAGRNLSFTAPEKERYPLLWSAYAASRSGASYPTAFNAANEIAVDAFIRKRISFLEIAETVDAVLQMDWSRRAGSLHDVLEIDSRVRTAAEELLKKHPEEKNR